MHQMGRMLVIASILTLLGCDTSPAEEHGSDGEAIAALFAMAQQAFRDRDAKASYATMTRTCALAYCAEFASACDLPFPKDSDEQRALDELLARHGQESLGDSWQNDQLAKKFDSVADLESFFVELYELWARGGEGPTFFFSAALEGELRDLKVEKDKARAIRAWTEVDRSGERKDRTERIRLRKEGGAWLLEEVRD